MWPTAGTVDRCLGLRDMNDNEANPQDYSDRALEYAGVIGYDAKGRAHKYNRVTATIFVTIDGDVVHVEQLSRSHMGQWIDYVEDEVGWLDCWWFDTHPSLGRQDAAKARAADVRYELAKQGNDPQEVPV